MAYCNQEYYNAQNMVNHALYQPVYFDCQWMENGGCGMKFGDLQSLINHLNMDHVGSMSNEENYCYWAGCKRGCSAFKAKYKLVNHLRIHTGEKPFVCQTIVENGMLCGKAFARSENLKIHNRIHTGEKPFKCFQPDCDKFFSNSSDRKKHMNVHKKGVMVCPVEECGRTYCHPSSLRKHLKTHGDEWATSAIPDRISESTLKRKIESDDAATKEFDPSTSVAKRVKLETSVASVDESSDDSRQGSPQPIGIGDGLDASAHAYNFYNSYGYGHVEQYSPFPAYGFPAADGQMTFPPASHGNIPSFPFSDPGAANATNPLHSNTASTYFPIV